MRFDELSFEEQAKSSTAIINNLSNAIAYHSQNALLKTGCPFPTGRDLSQSMQFKSWEIGLF